MTVLFLSTEKNCLKQPHWSQLKQSMDAGLQQSNALYATGMNEKEIESADLSSWFWTKLFSFEMNVFNAFFVNKMLT